MTNDDITRLTEAAKKVRATRAAYIDNPNGEGTEYAYDQALADFGDLANPSAILSLLQRLREAEEALKPFARQNTREMQSLMECDLDHEDFDRARTALKGTAHD